MVIVFAVCIIRIFYAKQNLKKSKEQESSLRNSDKSNDLEMNKKIESNNKYYEIIETVEERKETKRRRKKKEESVDVEEEDHSYLEMTARDIHP